MKEEEKSYEMKCTNDSCTCPYCKSHNIQQEPDEEYPLMRCLNCNKIYWSD